MVNLFNGVKSKEKVLNINTLDNFSLKDMKKIRDNLKKYKEYSSYFETKEDNNEFVKKIGKKEI